MYYSSLFHIESNNCILYLQNIFTAIIAYCNIVIFFPNPMLEPFIFTPSYLEKAIIFRHFLSNVKRKSLWESKFQYHTVILETGKKKQGKNLHNNLARTHYKILGKENSSDKYYVKFQDFSRIFYKNWQLRGLSRTLFKFQDFPGLLTTCGNPAFW